MTPEERQRVSLKLKNRTLTLKALPEYRVPRFLFQVANTNDYVYVTESQLSADSNYKVFLGPLGNWKKIELLNYSKNQPNQQDQQVGIIPFKSGGGLYIPLTIDLFRSGKKIEESLRFFVGVEESLKPLLRTGFPKKPYKNLASKTPHHQH